MRRATLGTECPQSGERGGLWGGGCLGMRVCSVHPHDKPPLGEAASPARPADRGRRSGHLLSLPRARVQRLPPVPAAPKGGCAPPAPEQGTPRLPESSNGLGGSPVPWVVLVSPYRTLRQSWENRGGAFAITYSSCNPSRKPSRVPGPQDWVCSAQPPARALAASARWSALPS